MQRGAITFDGNISDSISNYLSGLNTGLNTGTIESVHRVINTGSVYFKKVSIINEEFKNGNSIYFNNNIKIQCNIEFLKDIDNVLFDVRVNSADGIEILNTMNIYDGNFKEGKLVAGNAALRNDAYEYYGEYNADNLNGTGWQKFTNGSYIVQ